VLGPFGVDEGATVAPLADDGMEVVDAIGATGVGEGVVADGVRGP